MKNYNYLWDSHLNLFYQYGENSKLENNITKAFIHTLDSLNENEEKEFLSNLLGLSFPDGQFSIDCYLQRKPVDWEGKVKSIDEDKRYLFAFSPTGQEWKPNDIDGIDTMDLAKARPCLEKIIRKESSNQNLTTKELREKVEEMWKDISKVRENKGSDPDAWIFISVNSKPYCVIILENKLYDLNPYQLNNHIEKSLLLKEKKPNPILRSYQSIFNALKKHEKEYLVHHFLGFLIILGYVDCSHIDFADAFRADEAIRTRLITPKIRNVLKTIGSSLNRNDSDISIDNRNRSKTEIRLKVSYAYLREVNIWWDENKVYLSLSFGSTMKTGKEMLAKLNLSKFQNLNQDQLATTFHVSRHVGKSFPAIGESYIRHWKSIPDYVEFLKNNIRFLERMQTKQEILGLFEKIKLSGLVPDTDFDYLKFEDKLNQFSHNDNRRRFTVIPEITYSPNWSFDEIARLGEVGFENTLLQTIKNALSAFDLPYEF